MLIDQLKHVYIDGELELVEIAQYYPKILRKHYAVAFNLQTSGPDPQIVLRLRLEPQLERLLNPEIDQLIEQQSREGNAERRKPVLWEIERRLAADAPVA